MHVFEQIKGLKDFLFEKDILSSNDNEIDNLNSPLETPLKVYDGFEVSEAPDDIEQIRLISQGMLEIKGASYDEWKQLSPSQRLDAMQKIEIMIAKIQHRSPCSVIISNLSEKDYGFYDKETKIITLNCRYLDSSETSYKETLDTLIHEGRHAYQDYNMTERQVHPRDGEVNIWKWNEYDLGYQNAMFCGFEAYAMQPVETDARAFAEDVLNNYFEKIA